MKDLENLIAQVEDKMNPNPVDKFQNGLDSQYKTCAQEFRGWIADYATVLDTTVKAALESKLILTSAYKRLPWSSRMPV